MNSFREYLKDCYCGNPATFQEQRDWPPQLSQSPFVKPELVLKSKRQSVAGSKQPSNQQEIKIGDLCKLGKKVMLEGIAGSGKTILTRHICQQWAEGIGQNARFVAYCPPKRFMIILIRLYH